MIFKIPSTQTILWFHVKRSPDWSQGIAARQRKDRCIQFPRCSAKRGLMGTGALGAYPHWPEQRVAWAPLCFSEQLINPDSGHHSWDSELPAVQQAVPSFPNGHHLVQRHTMDPGKRLLAAVLWGGMGMPCFGQSTPRKTASALDCSTLFFTFYPWHDGGVFWVPPIPTPPPLTAILEMPGPTGMERCSLSFCPNNFGSILCVDKKTWPFSLWALCVLFSLPNMSIWSKNSLSFIWEAGAFLISPYLQQSWRADRQVAVGKRMQGK